jgi:hypothetical protein
MILLLFKAKVNKEKFSQFPCGELDNRGKKVPSNPLLEGLEGD